jgi:hypothetical protein
MNKTLRKKNRQPATSNQQPATSNSKQSEDPASAGQQQLTWLLLASFFVLAFVYFFWFGGYILFFQEQQYLFIYSSQYLDNFPVKPGGLLDLSGKFLTQFYISKFAGSLILALVLTLPGIILRYVNRRMIPGSILSPLFLIIPSCLLLLLQTHYYHLMAYNLGFILVLVYLLFTGFSENKAAGYTAVALFPLLFYFAGAYAMIFLGLYIIYAFLYVKSPQRYYYLFVLLAGTVISIILFREFLLVQSVQQLFLYPLPFINNPTHQVLFYILTGYIILYPLLCRLAGSLNLKRINVRVPGIVTVFFVLSAAIFILVKGYEPQIARVINLEKLAFEEKWDKAIEYHEEKPSENLIGQYFYNIALSETGQLCDRLFFGRQDFGTGSLILEWNSDHLNWGAYSFYTTGLVNEARRWAYEEMVVYGCRPQNMKLLTKTSLITGNYRMTGKYTGILGNTLFYQKWADEYSKLAGDSAAISSHPDLGSRTGILPQNDFFIHLESPEANLPLLVDENRSNRRAFEYMMSWLLLSKNVELLVSNIRLMKDMGYTGIPRHIEEAVMIYYNSTGTLPDLGGLSVSNETRTRFDQYFASFITARQDPSSLQEKMQKQFGNTFWYYFHFK